jgi:hypothetical protein
MMFRDDEGPIESFEWGRFVINGEVHSAEGEGVGKDICIIDGKVTPWEARHGHRLDPEMVEPVLGLGIGLLVIGNGGYGRINVRKKTLKKIRDDGVEEIRVEKTPDACKTYNQFFRQGKRVAFLAHGTC